MKFEDAFKIVLGFEGGYVNDPADKGGETNYGITASTLNSAKTKGWIPFDVTIQN
jgi:lysozyme family protein